MKARYALALLLISGTLFPVLAETPVLDNDEKKTFYALGLAVSGSLKVFDMNADEFALLVAGLTDGIKGQPAKVDLAKFRPQIQALATERGKRAAEKEKVQAVAFLEKMKAEPGAQAFDSGLIMFTITEGTGPNPSATDKVQVHYHGTLRDGTVFDSSVDRGQPAAFRLNQVIACWTEALQKMKVGGKAKLICPSSIAYGDRGSPPKIGPGAALVFEVELLAIQ